MKTSITTVMEIGAGEALDLASISDLKLERVLALDYSRHACRIARANLNDVHGADAVLADASFIPMKSNSMSLVYSSGVLEHFERPETILMEIARVLQTDGKTITFVPNMTSPWTLFRVFRQVMSRFCEKIPDWPVKEISFTRNQLIHLMNASGYRTDECFCIHISYLLKPLEIIVERIGGRLWETLAGRVLWALVLWFERRTVVVNLLGMEICHVGTPIHRDLESI